MLLTFQCDTNVIQLNLHSIFNAICSHTHSNRNINLIEIVTLFWLKTFCAINPHLDIVRGL